MLDAALRRLLDVCGASVGLVLLLPVLTVIALVIKREDGGPVLFRQIRVGRHGLPFNVLKFRTMRNTSGSGSDVTAAGDSRITRCGTMLRGKKLDELPQLWNVLVGQMSLVGPRPEVPRWMSRYPEAQRNKILSVRPGMTDFAAIELQNEEAILAGYDDWEDAYERVLMPLKFKHYSRYVDEQSVKLNIQLIIKTLRMLTTKRGSLERN